jgi:hypothetical protein
MRREFLYQSVVRSSVYLLCVRRYQSHAERLQRSMKLLLDGSLLQAQGFGRLLGAEVEQDPQGEDFALTLEKLSD